jgi:septal ring factor EnvC (AmiA/AmiB activator)
MPIVVSKKAVLVLLLLLAFQLVVGCAPAISQEQYNSVQAELKSTKEQLAAARAELASLKTQSVPVQNDQLEVPRKTVAALKPYIDLTLLILDQEKTLSQRYSKEITDSYANMQYADQRNRLNELLKRFDDTQFATVVESAWSVSADSQSRWESWTQTYSTLHKRLKDNFDTLSSQLNP